MSVVGTAPSAHTFSLTEAARLHPQVALRDEPFGALAYHYDTRKLVFLKARLLVELVRSLHDYPSADAAVDALVPELQQASYRAALIRLAASGMIDAC